MNFNLKLQNNYFQLAICLIILVMRKRVKLVIQLFIEAGKSIADMPLLLLQPFLVSKFIKLKVKNKYKNVFSDFDNDDSPDITLVLRGHFNRKRWHLQSGEQQYWNHHASEIREKRDHNGGEMA